MGDRTYIEIPGSRTHELPPLLIHGEPAVNATPLSEVMDLAADIVESEDMIPFSPVDENLAALEKAVGLRLTFRQPPPIDCFSNQFLIYLDSTVAGSAYQTWSHLTAEEPVSLPPERFHFQVHELRN